MSHVETIQAVVGGPSWSTIVKRSLRLIFSLPMLTFGVLYGFFLIEHERRKILHYNVTRRPTSAWVVQQLRETFPEANPYRYMVLDHDVKFNDEVIEFLWATGLELKRTSVQAPWQNGLAEHWVGSIRRELLDQVIPSPARVRELHQKDRLHDALQKDTPNRRSIENKPSPHTQAIAHARLGGLYHRYGWRKAE